MKKLLSLVLAVMMLFSLSAVAMAEEEAGFDEFELGVEGEQEVGFMTMAMVYFQPVDMAPVDQATAKENTDLHIEVDLTANENGYAFPVDQWVPYLTIDFVIRDTEGKEVTSGSMMPMAASDGPHYGANIKMDGDGLYTVTFTVKFPDSSTYLIHTDETGPDKHEFPNAIEYTYDQWQFTSGAWAE